MPSNKLPLQTTPEFSSEQKAFLAKNQEMLEQLATFADFAPERLTLGFVSVNFTKDRDTMLEALRQHPRCQDIQFAVLDFPDPELRFLRDAILERLLTLELQPDKKLVLVIAGLEYSIGMIGDSPPALQDLNYVRDSFTTSVPHPMLICLPDWSLTRLARYAPDFWAWRLAVFRFEHLSTTAANAKQETLHSNRIIGSLDIPEQQTQIDLLLRLLMEYDAAKPSVSYDCKTHIDILNRLGELYDLKGETKQAERVLTQALNLVPAHADSSILVSQINVLHNLASVIHRQGDVEQGLSLFQQALELSNYTGDVKSKAATLHNMARVIAGQGDIEQAMRLWNESLQLLERTGDMQGKAATLNNMAGLIAAQGDIEQAMRLWNESLQLLERTGDMQGKAGALHNMAISAYQQGETEQAAELLKQCIQALVKTRAYIDLVIALGNLAVIDIENKVTYLAQAVWLCLRIQAPLVSTLNYIRYLFNAAPQGDALGVLLAATALWFYNVRGEGHPQIEQLREDSVKLLSIAANAQGIQTQEAFDAWRIEQQLNDPDFFLPQLNQRLEAMIGDGWLFDPNAVTQ